MIRRDNKTYNQVYFKINEPINSYVYSVDKSYTLVEYKPIADYNLVFIAYNNNDELVMSINKMLNSLEQHPNVIILDCNNKAQLPAILLKNFRVINNLNFSLLQGKFKDYTLEEQAVLSYIYCVKELLVKLPSFLYNGDD